MVLGFFNQVSPQPQSSRWDHPLRAMLSRCLTTGLTTGLTPWLTAATLGSSLFLAATPAQALESINLKPRFLLEEPLTLDVLESFVKDGKKTDDLQVLLDLMSGFSDLEEIDIRAFFSNVSDVDGALVDRFLISYVGEVVLQEVSLVLDPVNGANPDVWRTLGDALTAAAADDKVSMLEVLQQYELDRLEVDVRRFTQLQKRLETDVKDLQAIAGVQLSEELSGGLDQFFCGPDSEENQQLLALVNSLTATSDMDTEAALSQVVEIDPKLVDRFISSFFGDIVLRQTALILDPDTAKNVKVEDLKVTLGKSINDAAKDGRFSVMEALEFYEPNAVKDNVDKMSGTVQRMQGDLQDFQSLLDLDELANLTVIIQELICAPDTTP